jgi:hypothetical protein
MAYEITPGLLSLWISSLLGIVCTIMFIRLYMSVTDGIIKKIFFGTAFTVLAVSIRLGLSTLEYMRVANPGNVADTTINLFLIASFFVLIYTTLEAEVFIKEFGFFKETKHKQKKP